MKTVTYTNAQLRSIFNGLGYATHDATAGSDFPLSMDDSPLTDVLSVQAIQKFQVDHQMKMTGMIDSETLSAVQTVMQKLNSELNRVVNIGFPLDRPIYDAETVFAVKLVQQRFLVNGIASNALRAALAQRQIDGSHTPPYPLQNLAQAFYLGVGDRDW